VSISERPLRTPDAGDTIKIEVELHQLPASFTGTATHVSGYVSSGSVASLSTITGLAAGNYGWAYRAVDNHGLATNWVLAGNPDFIVQISSTPGPFTVHNDSPVWDSQKLCPVFEYIGAFLSMPQHMMLFETGPLLPLRFPIHEPI